MSSHREAPEISKDPVADSTDLYAFVSPDTPDTVTLIANYIPLQAPAGGPNFYPFGDDVLYEIHVDNNGDGRADVTYQFRFSTCLRNDATFLYNTGPIQSLDDPNWNSRQFYSVTKVTGWGRRRVLGEDLPVSAGQHRPTVYSGLSQPWPRPRCRHWPTAARSSPASGPTASTWTSVPFSTWRTSGRSRTCTRRSGSARSSPRRASTRSITSTSRRSRSRCRYRTLRRGGDDVAPDDPRAVIGVWTTASRQQVRLHDHEDHTRDARSGPYVQLSRLGNPLVNEVVIPLGRKDEWNRRPPSDDKDFQTYVLQPELATLLPPLYPGVFPNLADLVASGKPRADLDAILMTGIPSGLIPGFQNFTGPVEADMLRLNTAIPPAASPNILGLLGGDVAGFPNGRRPTDDVVTIELRAIAGVTYPLVDPTFTPDAAASVVTDGLLPGSVSSPFLDVFPYLGVPYDGYSNPSV
jgi:hypothetical protein